MPGWKVPLADVSVPEDDIAIVADVYRSGWLSMGPRTEEFERALADYTGAAHALAVANGTAALHLICLAAGLGPGDEVIVPSLTFVASVNAIAYTGATPVFVDIASLDRAVAERRRGRGGDHAAHPRRHGRRVRRPPRRDRGAARARRARAA